jgi:hypothetical protein
LSGSTNKKVIIERFDREALKGFVNPQTWLLEAGVELLSTSGIVTVSPYTEIKTVCFVKDLDGPTIDRERKIFNTRPKSEGLWIRMLFRDADYLDGLLPNNLLQLEPAGFSVVPPDPSANNQKVFVPRAALQALKVLGVIGSPLRRRKREPPSKDQIPLFD